MCYFYGVAGWLLMPFASGMLRVKVNPASIAVKSEICNIDSFSCVYMVPVRSKDCHRIGATSILIFRLVFLEDDAHFHQS